MNKSNTRKKEKQQWFAFRDEIIERDEDKCVKCGRSMVDGAILQVHHKIYITGKRPWEYPKESCETLCRGCHAATHGKIKPKFGWEFLFEEDLGEIGENCEWCGTELRYIFYINHPKWGVIGVGTYCCDYLTDSTIASNLAESQKSFESRLNRFIKSSRWKIDKSGIHRIKQKHLVIEIQPYGEFFKIFIEGIKGKKRFVRIEAAKKFVFEGIESGEITDFINKKAQSI